MNQIIDEQTKLLTPKQRAFIHNYILYDGNASEAAFATGGFTSKPAAAVWACRTLKNDKFKEAIAEVMDQSGLSIEDMLRRLFDRINAEPTLERQLKGFEMLLKLIL